MSLFFYSLLKEKFENLSGTISALLHLAILSLLSFFYWDGDFCLNVFTLGLTLLEM